MRRASVLIAALALSTIGFFVSGQAGFANTPTSSADCQVGVTAGAVGYHDWAYNSVEVFFDGALVYDNQDFGTGFHFVWPNPDPTISHTYQVDIDSDDNENSLHTGLVTIEPCETPTTTIPPTTTTVPPAPPSTIPLRPPTRPPETFRVIPGPAVPVSISPAFTG